MSERPVAGAGRPDRAAALASALILLVVGGLLVGLVLLVVRGRGPEAGALVASPSPSAVPGTFLIADPRPAPPLALRDPSGGTVSLASLRGRQVLVFFGYTHCPDVCPVTIGTVGNALATVGGDARALFVSVDPERDTPAWLAEFSRFMPTGFTALTGSAAEVRATADAWGIRYSRVETGSADGYSISHTADVFLVDADGLVRARFPFGTEPEPISAAMREVAATPVAASSAPPSGSPTASATAAPGGTAAERLLPEVVSTAVWAGGASPLIVRLFDATGPIDDRSARTTFQLLGPAGEGLGPVVTATAVQPPGLARVLQLAYVDVPRPGSWRLRVRAFRAGRTLEGETVVRVLDPAGTAALGRPAPTVATPTLPAPGGETRAVTTDPQPDLRLYVRSTADLLAARTPFVLVVDSVRFRVTPACGKAVAMARYLADRWAEVGFVHLEPYRYGLVSSEPILSGDPSAPTFGPVAAAWGLGSGEWGATSVPWVFVVDAEGTVRAKYQGLVGSDDVDVILAALLGRTNG